MTYRRARLVLALLVVGLSALGAAACESETGPGAPPRTNGCIDEDCTVGTTKDAGKDAATQDAQ
jgi:hypothetical protein